MEKLFALEGVTNLIKIYNPFLRCFREEADDRIKYHLSHAVKIDKYRSVAVLTPDIFLFVPYTIVRSCCTLILTAPHALTGFESTSEVSNKAAVLWTAIKGGGELLYPFGRSELTDNMIETAEKFLIRWLSPTSKCSNFDELRYDVIHGKKFQFYLENFLVTSESTERYIRRAYFLAYFWLHPPFVYQISLIPENMDMWDMK